jgi:hypothetical protein
MKKLVIRQTIMHTFAMIKCWVQGVGYFVGGSVEH